MKIAGSLDTNVVLRLILNDVPKQYKLARKLIEEDKIFEISDLAVAEIVFVLERNYKMSRQDIELVMTNLLINDKFECNFETLKKALSDFAKHKALSFEDCYLNSVSVKNLYTFDKKLAKQLKKSILVE